MKKSKYKTVRGLLAKKERWIKGWYELNGRYCLMGAIKEIYKDDRNALSIVDKVIEAIKKLFPRCRTSSILYFNDTKRRSHSDILKVLKLAKV